MRLRASILTLLCTVAPAGLAAQDSLIRVTIDSGTLVRMHAGAGSPVQGRLVQPLTPSSTFLWYCAHPGPACATPADSSAIQRVPTTSLTALDVQHGDYLLEGLAVGAVWGALWGVFLGATSAAFCDADTGPFMCNYSVGTYALVTAIGFALITGSTGAAKPKWKPAP